MIKEDFNEGLLGFLDASPTPFHTTKKMEMIFETQKWNLKAGNISDLYPVISDDAYSLFKIFIELCR